MLKETLEVKNNLVKQSNKLARANFGFKEPDNTRRKLVNYGTSPWLERILSLVMAHVKTTDFDFQKLDIPVSALDIAGKKLSGHEYRDIKAALRNLVSAYYSIENPAEQEYEVCTVFSKLQYKKGVISALFNTEMKPYLLQLTSEFTTYEFSEFRRLGTMYTQQLYRFLKSWQGLPEVVIPLGQLHSILSVPATLKSNFANFRIRVLEPVHTEITEKTQFRYQWEPVMTKNKVTAIQFFFRGRRAALLEPEDAAKKAKEEHDKLQSESTACFFAHKDRGVVCTPKRTKRCKYCTTRGVKYVKDGAKKQAGTN